jgi:tetratricopeptide (TPR) repeat protein
VPGWLRAVVLRGLSTDPAARYPSMAPLLDALGRDPRAAWRKRAVAALSAVALAGVAVGGFHLIEQRRHLCQGAEAKLTGGWDDAEKASARAAFTHTGLPYAALAWASVERALDIYRHDWVAAHAEACEVTRKRGEQSEELLDLRMSCLAQRRQELKAVAELFAAADAQLVEKAERVAAGLSPLADCSNVEALTAPLRPPKDQQAKARVEQARGQIAAARALKDGGKYREGLAAADRALATAREAHYDPVEAEALAQRGELQALADHHEEADATLEEALCAAQRGRHDEVAARCAMLLAGHSGDQARPADARWWARLASAVLQRAGQDPVAEGRLAETVARLLFYEGRYEEALAELQRGEALMTKALGAEHSRRMHRALRVPIVPLSHVQRARH